MSHTPLALLRQAVRLADAGERAVLCMIVRARGSTPQTTGSLMLVDANANLHGTVGGGCVEADVRRSAHRMLVEGRSGVLRYRLDHDYGWDDGLICGGTVEVAVAPLPNAIELARVIADLDARRPTALAIEVELETEDEGRAAPASQRFILDLPPRDRLYIAGAGHVGQALARLALPLDFEVALFDDRPDLLERFAPPGAAVVAGDIAAALRQAPVDAATWCVVVTRGHRHDEQALAAVLDRGARYVGMIGSRRKVKLIFDDLLERGIPAAALERVHAPIGLDIGSVTVEEIALSIAAELVQVRRAAEPAVAAIDSAGGLAR
ncbi:MAG: XdhC family protein [Phycisphaerales bacterium]|nr:XdhC family protein [Phycisphaerales bacterium]